MRPPEAFDQVLVTQKDTVHLWLPEYGVVCKTRGVSHTRSQRYNREIAGYDADDICEDCRSCLDPPGEDTDYCHSVQNDGEVCGRELPCHHHSDTTDGDTTDGGADEGLPREIVQWNDSPRLGGMHPTDDTRDSAGWLGED